MRINILGVGFDNVTMDEALARGEELLCSEGAHYVVTPNPEIVETCRADAAANAAVNGADLVLPDGIGIVYGAKILHQPLRGRVPGIEFGTGMIERCAKLGKSVYLLGAKPGVAEQAAENLKNRFPGLSSPARTTAILRRMPPSPRRSRRAARTWRSCASARRSRSSSWRNTARRRVVIC